jgi:hypothetical protein
LQAFVIFFFILIAITSLIFSTIELGNYNHLTEEELRYRDTLLTYPGKEYLHIPRFLKNPLSVIRIALADFDYNESIDLQPFENYLYWITWLILVIITCIVFLNFIIAEVSSSYESVKCKVKGLIEQDRAQLITESEDMLMER